MKVTAVFDIGKTNKKFFLFDKKLKEVYRTYTIMNEIEDDDGFACDNLAEIIRWARQTLKQFIADKRYKIQAVNFSAYGASLVHLDKKGEPITPLYNYLKPVPSNILEDFYAKYGDQWTLASETCSPPLGMLNAGLHLYWLKYAKPKLFGRVKWSLHLPQYLSYLFTGLPVSDFTSIGCHTMLWDYAKNDYHEWVYQENLDRILAPIVETSTTVMKTYGGKRLKFGVGIHDSSSALLPYFIFAKTSFLLISTGTWSISMNPFSEAPLTKVNLQNDVLKFMQIDGRSVKAARLFLGNEYKIQVKRLLKYFGKEPKYHHSIKINWSLIEHLRANYQRKFSFESIKIAREVSATHPLSTFENFEEAYHQLMLELVEMQIKNSAMALGKTSVSKIYIDGGFIDNEVYVQLLADHFKNHQVETARSGLGSALGSAIVISGNKLNEKSLAKHYKLKQEKKRKMLRTH